MKHFTNKQAIILFLAVMGISTASGIIVYSYVVKMNPYAVEVAGVAIVFLILGLVDSLRETVTPKT